MNTRSAPGEVLFYKHPGQSPAAETQGFSGCLELGCPTGLWLLAHRCGVVLQVLVRISYASGIFQSHVEFGGKTGRPSRRYTLLQKLIQHSAFSEPGLGCAIAETWARRDAEALATVSLHLAVLKHPPLISIPGAELLLIKPRPARAWQGTQAGRNHRGAKGRPDRLIPSFMKWGGCCFQSLQRDRVWMWCCLDDQPGQETTQHHMHRAGSSRVRSKGLLCSCSYQIFLHFCRGKYSMVGAGWGKHLHTSTRAPPRPGRAPCSPVRKHELCLSTWITWGWHKALGHSPGLLPRWDFVVISAQLSLGLQKELGCRGLQGVLQTLWQRLFDDCCAELKIPQLWLAVQDN